MSPQVKLVWVVGISVLASIVGACVGDDPTVSAPDETDAATSGDASGDDAEVATDANVDGAIPPHPLQIEAGGESACALLSDRTVWCWGSNTYGQIGLPLGASPPRRVQGIDNVASISLGTFSMCALKMDNTVWCWGRSTENELGRPGDSDPSCGSARCNPVPTQVPGLLATSIAAGDAMACAISPPRGEVTCWGHNDDGQCGKPASAPTAPNVVPGIMKAVRIKLGLSGHTTCALDSGGLVWCWGKNDRGQLGHTPGTLGDIGAPAYAYGFYNAVPRAVTTAADGGGASFDQVTDLVSAQTVCAVRANGSVWCWGRNSGDELDIGHGDLLAHSTPMQIAPIVGASSIQGGRAFCALLDGGAPWCWGEGSVTNGNGQLVADGGCTDLGSTAVSCFAPAPVPGPALSSLGGYGSLAFGITRDGVAVGWGINTADGRDGHPIGTAGDDDAGNNNTPTPVLGLP